MCIEEGCKKISTYNFFGEKAIYCFTHKLNDMIDVKHKKCIYEGCMKRPSFGIKGEKATHCAEHKLAKMIGVIQEYMINTMDIVYFVM
jgi:hypothetical protein